MRDKELLHAALHFITILTVDLVNDHGHFFHQKFMQPVKIGLDFHLYRFAHIWSERAVLHEFHLTVEEAPPREKIEEVLG
jgi:hypothetical protein